MLRLHVMDLRPLNETESTFRSFDGTELFYRSWIPEGGYSSALILFHRGHEHSGRFAELVRDLQAADTAYFAWDSRGHGRSPGERGYATHLMDVVRDADAFVAHVTEVHRVDIENISVLAHSVAAVVIGLWVHDFAPRIRSVILATPAFEVKLYVPFAIPGLRAQLWFARRRGAATPYVKSYVSGKLLTHDTAEAVKYDSDPLVSKQIAVNVLLNLCDSSKRLVQDAAAITTPALVLAARTDWVVKNRPARVFSERLSANFKRTAVFRGFYHAIFHERERKLPIDACRAFLEDSRRLPVDRSALLNADQNGPTADEYQWLKAGLPPISFKRLGYRLMRLLMRTVGSLSEGIRIGWKHGFDSGSSLDYVYRNEPRGATPLGRLMDRTYLDSPGWTGIRQRKLNLEALLDEAIDRTAAARPESPIKIMDVAGGPGRYLCDTVKRRTGQSIEVLVRDWNTTGLEEGKALAASLGLATVSYEHADAFDEAGLAAIGQKDIVVVSGLYELFPENAKVLASLSGIFRAVRPGGYLLYTNQPWHPQLEFIAEVLLNREMQPWVMRRRTQAEMDELVRSVGFNKITMRLDNEGIFTVSLAERPA